MWIIDMEGSLCQNSRREERIEKGHEKLQAGITHLLCFFSEQNVDEEAASLPTHTQRHRHTYTCTYPRVLSRASVKDAGLRGNRGTEREWIRERGKGQWNCQRRLVTHTAVQRLQWTFSLWGIISTGGVTILNTHFMKNTDFGMLLNWFFPPMHARTLGCLVPPDEEI